MIPKFRAFDKINKAMLYEIDVYRDGKIGFDYDYAQKVYGGDFFDVKERFFEGDDYFWMEDGFDLMQSTGLVDRNGVEIFEGDILSDCSSQYHAHSRWYCVFFHGGDESSGGIGYQFKYVPHDSLCGGYIPRVCPSSVEGMFCLGNRYANPELLRAEEMEGKK